jgi:hypothetical protein
MATTIQDFFTRAASKQFSRDFLFRVKQIDLVGGVSFDGEGDLVYAKTAALPGRTIDNKTVGYFGQEFQLPGRATYANAAGYSIDFYADEGCQIRTKLEAASRAVWNNETSTGQYAMPGNESVINLVQIDKQLNDVRNIELVGASIRDIGEIAYIIAEGTGEVITFNTTFAYHFYRDFS